ncbi:lysine 2,3-aminomutase [ANME-1 cluster archaeon ex4572_4]|nr:MAG: lysine 2,3-aminomutase [ANME-1 cluster archaeon ex4572_4]HDN68440.1 KamA family radical SAM protein [Methanomicrobia archaeon]
MTWREELKKDISTLEQLKEFVDLTPKEKRQLREITEIHPMRITRYYLSLIDWDDPDDPIRKMAVPSEAELNLLGSYDTSGELENTKMPGLQHKYSQTALILATNQCSTYCRHCFRKRLVGLSSAEILQRFNEAVKYIEKHSEVNNVLVSGGDPFVLPTAVLREFLEQLSAVPHLNFIRFGTRVPVTFPERILEDEELLRLLEENSRAERRIYVVTQFNHPREITEKATAAVARLISAGVILNNQTVLLKGVNDDPAVLAELQNKLVSVGVNPYYIFQCRPVKRVKNNFQVPLQRGYEIVEAAKKRLNGHSKRFKYILSHQSGKIEIVGVEGEFIYFKHHQAKEPENIGKLFRRRLNKTAGWLDELEEVE